MIPKLHQNCIQDQTFVKLESQVLDVIIKIIWRVNQCRAGNDDSDIQSESMV
jgi:hypothetical protein